MEVGVVTGETPRKGVSEKLLLLLLLLLLLHVRPHEGWRWGSGSEQMTGMGHNLEPVITQYFATGFIWGRASGRVSTPTTGPGHG
jgi:hypothetical protein